MARKKIKAFIVDDSATVRTVVKSILESSGEIEVIGTAQDPIFALARMEKAWPEVIVLDVEMPRMDGLSFLKKIMAEHPTPVVMCSTLTEKGSSTSLKALSYGALEVVAKPKAQLREGLTEKSRLLIHAVRAAAQANMGAVRSSAAPRPQRRPLPSKQPARAATKPVVTQAKSAVTRTNPIVGRLVAIGTSTGGTQALESVLPALPANAPPILVVQHMPEKFTRAFAERLNSLCKVDVKEAEDGDAVLPGRVLIAPGGRHLLLGNIGVNPRVAIKDGPPVSRHRPSVDVLFRSMAKLAGKHALGIIMTGMGDDGANGLKEMFDVGAQTIAQDGPSCIVHGMPAVAVARGAVQQEVPLLDIPAALMRFSCGG